MLVKEDLREDKKRRYRRDQKVGGRINVQCIVFVHKSESN